MIGDDWIMIGGSFRRFVWNMLDPFRDETIMIQWRILHYWNMFSFRRFETGGSLESEIASEQARSAALRDAFEGRRARYATAEEAARNAEFGGSGPGEEQHGPQKIISDKNHI